MSKIYVDEILPKDNATVDGSNISGNIVQIVSMPNPSTPFDFNGTSDATCTSVNFTPKFANSKIWITSTINFRDAATNTSGYFTIYQDSTAVTGGVGEMYADGSTTLYGSCVHNLLLDAGSTTTRNYSLKVRVASGGATWRTFWETSGNNRGSFVRIMEIAQ